MQADLREFIRTLEVNRELIHVTETLSPKHEIPAVIQELSHVKNKALFFDHVKGYEVPVVGNLLGTRKRLALALGVPEQEIREKYFSCKERRIKPVVVKDAPVKEVEILSHVDLLGAIPVLTHHEKDSSPYLTCAIAIAKDPETGIRGMGIHRIQIKDKNRIGIFLATPPLAHFLAKSEAKGLPLEIAVVIGVDPLTFFSSVIRVPYGTDKLEIAGGLAGRPVEIVCCSTVGVEVPASAEFVLEGQVLPGERQEEGPFGESTGYYFRYQSPVAEIKAITHRKNPIYQALLPFAYEDAMLVELCGEMEHLNDLQKLYPSVRRVHLSNLGLMAVVQIKKESDREAKLIIDHLLGNPFTKTVIVVDEDVDPSDDHEVKWALSTRVQPERDVIIKSNMDGLVIDPSTGGHRVSPELFSTLITKTSKMGIDATGPTEAYARFEKIDTPEETKRRLTPLLQKYSIS